MIKHPSDTYGDKRSPILALFQKMLLTKPEDDPFLRSIKDGAFIFTYVHAQMKNRRVVMKEFKSKSADMMMVVRLVFADAFCVVVVVVVVSLWV